MNLRKTGWANQIATRSKQSSNTSTLSASSNVQASDFMKDMLSTLDSLKSRYADSPKDFSTKKDPAPRLVEKKFESSSTQGGTKGLARSFKTPEERPVKVKKEDQNDGTNNHQIEADDHQSKELSSSENGPSTKIADSIQTKENEEKTGIVAADKRTGNEEEKAAQQLVDSGVIGLFINPGELSQEGAQNMSDQSGEAEEKSAIQNSLQSGAMELLNSDSQAGSAKDQITSALVQGLVDGLESVSSKIEEQVSQDKHQSGAMELFNSEGETVSVKDPMANSLVQELVNGSGMTDSQKKGVQVAREAIQSALSRLLSKGDGKVDSEILAKKTALDQETEKGQDLKETQKKGEGFKIEKGKFSLPDSLGAGLIKDKLKDLGEGIDLGKAQTDKNSHSTFMLGKEGEKGTEDFKESVRFGQGEALSKVQDSTPLKISDSLKTAMDQAGGANREEILNGDISNSKGPNPIPNSETMAVLGNSVTPEKTTGPKLTSMEQAQGAAKMVLSQDQPFTIKKYSPDSMEVSLEPEGLGKVNIELKLTDHHLNAQIMVNDLQGKDLLEKNLPHLLNELGKGGLQIGEFSVSLKNQGQDQNPSSLAQPEARGEPLAVLEARARPSTNDNHLIHIII